MTLLIIDASNLVHRHYHALKHSGADVDGGAAGLVCDGALNTVSKLVRRHQATQVMIAFDTRGSAQWRYALVPEYKAGRSETPPTIPAQLAEFQAVSEAVGFGILQSPEHEADDLIAAAAVQANAEETNTIIVSSDKDLFQVIGPRCVVHRLDGDMLFTAEALKAKYKVTPSQWTEYTGLIGEGADNLPGAPGIGKGTAEKILTSYQTVAEALADEALDTVIAKRFATALRNGEDMFNRCKSVGTLDISVPVDLDSGKLNGIDPQEAYRAASSAGYERAASALASALVSL